jgi:hypothetical protein
LSTSTPQRGSPKSLKLKVIQKEKEWITITDRWFHRRRSATNATKNK